MIALAAIAAFSVQDGQVPLRRPIAWQGTAVVHDGKRDIAIGVDTRIESDDRVVSNSWPLTEGREAGERRLILDPRAKTATLLRGGTTRTLPQTFVVEELGQFGVYRQYQVAATQCAAQTQTGQGSNVIEVYSPGPVPTAFRCSWGRIVTAANWVAGSAPQVRQEFRFTGQWNDRGMRFPRAMRITRDGKPYFDLKVTRFRSE